MHHLRRFALDSVLKCKKRCYLKPLNQENTRSAGTIEIPPKEGKVTKFSIPGGILGQPTCHTHPHLIEPGYLTAGITQMEYRERRDTLVDKLLETQNVHTNHVIVIPAAAKQYMSDKIPYVFRQNSDFFYLTGCLEPSAILVMVKGAEANYYKTILFVHDRDSHAEQWEGPRTGCAAAGLLFAVDEARPVQGFNNFITNVTSNRPTQLWYHSEDPPNREIHSTIRSTVRSDGVVTLSDPQHALHGMRVIKSPAEIQLMRETCSIGAQAINTAMACTKPGVSESTINAVLDYTCRQGGAEHLAFPPVVAGGPRATHIHYVSNNQLLDEREMLLVDSGSQRWLYNSDISRTWPVSGTFSQYHRILYEIVLTVQKRLIELLAEQRPSLDQLFDSMCRLLGMYLQQEGIISKDISANELFSRAYQLCPHHVSHYLGLDVHDAPLVRRHVPVAPGMVVTVEPGLYIHPEDHSVPSEFRGVGIRIEDDVLITEASPDVLTHACVKEVSDIEAIVGKHTLSVFARIDAIVTLKCNTEILEHYCVERDTPEIYQ